MATAPGREPSRGKPNRKYDQPPMPLRVVHARSTQKFHAKPPLKAFVSQLDARIGPKAAAVTSTVLTVGECRGQAKLQKEHAVGHSCNCFCFCGCVVSCGRGVAREALRSRFKSRGRARDHATHKHTNLVNYVADHEAPNLQTWSAAPGPATRCPSVITTKSGDLPQHDDRVLFEFLILEGAQAGLSWDTILQKRENYRAAFDGFNPQRIARYDRRKLASLLRNPGIIRNRLKIASAVRNAKAFLAVQKEFGSFDRYIWQFVGGKPRVNAWRPGRRVPASTPESDAMSKDLKKRGFNFVGSTICYAFMQAVGHGERPQRGVLPLRPGQRRRKTLSTGH